MGEDEQVLENASGSDAEETSLSADDDLSSSVPLGEDGGPSSPSASSPSSEYQDIVARLEASERRGQELETSLRQLASSQHGPRSMVPAAFQKPQDQWTVRDLWEATQYMQQQQMQQVTAEHATRGRLNAEVMGQGNDYDSLMQKHIAPLAQRNPEISPFLQQLPPEDRYMLGVMHEIYARSGRDLVKTVKTIFNALGARQQGARDVTKAVNNAAKGAALKVFQGGGARQTGRRALQTAEDVWNLSDEEFRRTL